MPILWSEVTVSLDGLSQDHMLSDWRWLLDESLEPIILTAMGDLFLRDGDGRVVWLEASSGKLSHVAESVSHFTWLVNEGETGELWFKPELVRSLKRSGMTLGENEVYSLEEPEASGGKYEASNIKPLDVMKHFSAYGRIHKRMRDSRCPLPSSELGATLITG